MCVPAAFARYSVVQHRLVEIEHPRRHRSQRQRRDEKLRERCEVETRIGVDRAPERVEPRRSVRPLEDETSAVLDARDPARKLCSARVA